MEVKETVPVQKTKAELKAERRAKQEAERAAKQAKRGTATKQGAKASSKPKTQPPAGDVGDNNQTGKQSAKKPVKQQSKVNELKKVPWFDHLPQTNRDVSVTENIKYSPDEIHHAFVRIALQFSQGVVSGSNGRCVALIHAFIEFINDYTTPEDKQLKWHLESKLKQAINYVELSRPKSISMGSAIKFLRAKLAELPVDISETEAKSVLTNHMEKFIRNNILLAGQEIAKLGVQHIRDGDNILVFGSSSLIERILRKAKDEGLKFHVLVVDARPKLGGRKTLRELTEYGIECSYLLLTQVSQVIQKCSKVMAGVHGIFSNGYVMSSIGLATLAPVASFYNVPIIICCETYKFTDGVQTDAFVKNELGDPRDILTPHDTTSVPAVLPELWENKSLKALNLTYDVTSSKYISVVLTELGQLTCIAAPGIMRKKIELDKLNYD